MNKGLGGVAALQVTHADTTLKESHEQVSLFADIFYLNCIPFLLTISEYIELSYTLD